MHLKAVLVIFFFYVAEALNTKKYNILSRKQLTPSMGQQIIGPRIVNGQIAHPFEFKYIAGLQTVNSAGNIGTCGGTLISRTYVLTAAHCLFQKQRATVYLGSVRLQTGFVKYNVTSRDMIIHPRYDNLNNDIGLVRIPATPNSPTIQPISLPTRDVNPARGSIATIMGWGRISTNGPVSELLLYAFVRIISNNDCRQADDMKICTVPNSGGPCKGDSGGPMVLRSPEILIGVISFTPSQECLSGKPDIYTRVTSYLDWIQQETGIRT